MAWKQYFIVEATFYMKGKQNKVNFIKKKVITKHLEYSNPQGKQNYLDFQMCLKLLQMSIKFKQKSSLIFSKKYLRLLALQDICNFQSTGSEKD